MRVLKLLLVIVASAYLLIILVMYVQQRSLQYFPGRLGTPPSAHGLVGVSEDRVRTVDGETIVLWYAEARTGMPTVLFFHGNAGEISGRADRMAFLQSRGFGALFVSYRGYGGSTGSISEQGFITDALTAYDVLLSRGVPPERVALIGESLGTGVAVHLAAMKPVGAVALEAPYTATVDVAADLYWWLPVRLLMKDQFRSRDYIKMVHAPLLIQHGELDRLIPVAQGRALFAMANEPKQLVIMPDAGHDFFGNEEMWSREVAFFLSQIKPQ